MAGKYRTFLFGGIGFLVFSYLPYLAPARAIDLSALTIFWTVWCQTVIILCDALRREFEGASLLDAITADNRSFLSFIAAGTACGLVLDGSAQWLGKLWIYPYWSPYVYWSCFIVGFCAYWLLIAETYLMAKCALRPLFERHRMKPPDAGWAYAYLCAAAGAGCICWGIAAAMRRYAGSYSFALTTPTAVHGEFRPFLTVIAGVLLLSEFALLKLRKTPLLRALVRGGLPLCAVLAGGWITGLLMETANAAHHFWIYTNWPLQNVTLDRVPVVVLALWPLQYVTFLAVFGIFAPREIWRALVQG